MSTIRAAMTHRLLGETSGPLAGIYVVTHRASGLRYVGQSRDIARRWSEHRNAECHGSRLARALKKYGPLAFQWEIVELCAREDLNDREAFYVWAFDCLSPNGYNLRTGGGQAEVVSDDARAKIAEACRLRSMTPEWQEKQAEGIRRRNADPEWKAKNAEARRRRNANPKWRENVAEAARLRADPKAYTLVHTQSGAVERGTRRELRERTGIDNPALCDLVRGLCKTRKGWRLARPEENQ